MDIQETKTEEYIQFYYKKDNYYFVVRVDFNDNVECKRIENDAEIDVEISDDERLKWIESRDEFDKVFIVKKLYRGICDIKAQLYKVVKDYQKELGLEDRFLEDSLDKRLFNLADSININYSDLAHEVSQIPDDMLDDFEKKNRIRLHSVSKENK